MRTLSAICPACGGVYDGKVTSRFITCEYCGTRFARTKDELEALGFVDADGDGFDDNDAFDGIVDVDESDAPMPEFAREACQAYLNIADKSYFLTSNKIVRGLGIAAGNEIFLIHDDTMFKTGKNGFAITREGMYCRNFGEKTTNFVSWQEFAKGQPLRLDGGYILQGHVSLCYFTDSTAVCESELMPLYRRLYNHARKVM